MEPSGGSRWQSAANRLSAEARKEAKTIAAGCNQLPFGAHGKEEVDGSSPSEGSRKGQQMAFFVASEPYEWLSTVPQPVPKMSPQCSSRSIFLAGTVGSETIEHLHRREGAFVDDNR